MSGGSKWNSAGSWASDPRFLFTLRTRHPYYPRPQAICIALIGRECETLTGIESGQTALQQLVRSALNVLAACEGASNTCVSEYFGASRDTVVTERLRFAEAQPCLQKARPERICEAMEVLLADRPRSGATPSFSAEGIAPMVALVWLDLLSLGRRVSHWPRGSWPTRSKRKA